MVTLAKFVSLNLTVSFSFYQNTSFKGDKIFDKKVYFSVPKPNKRAYSHPQITVAAARSQSQWVG